MAYKTIYARITPVNGVSGEKYSVSVSGATATVEGQKTWTSGSLNFAITPTSEGVLAINFKNDTLNQIVGVRTLGVDNLKYSGTGTFTVGSQTQSTNVYNIGYINYSNVPAKVGVELNDDLKINDQLIDMAACYILDVTGSPTVSLFFSYNNSNIITPNMGIIIKLTNLSNNATYVSDVMSMISFGVETDKHLGIGESRVSQVAILRSIMTPGTNVKAEISYVDTNAVSLDVVGTFVKTETYNSKSYDIGWGVNAYDYFVSKIGRAPLAGENISFNVGPNTALVATSISVGALHFDNRFNNVGSLTVSNSGIVLGHGKRGRGPSEVANQENLRGGAALLNTSTININTINSGIIAGGGGGGASVSGSFNNVAGGDGAPWGRDDTSVSFTAVTSSGTNAGGGRFPGAGGGWGEYGQQNSENDYYNYGYPGYVIKGLGTINNVGDGITKGS